LCWWRRLAGKLFLSHVIVVLLAAVSAVVVGQVLASRHVAAEEAIAGASMAEHFLRILNISFLWAAGGVVLLAGVAGSLFAWYLSRPMVRLRQAARAIAAGNYGEQVEVSSRDELSELGVAFNQMAQSLESQEQLRRELMANVAHELRTPFTSIQGYMEALQDEVFPPDAATFELVHEEAGRLKRLAEELAQLASLESRQTPWNPEPLDVVLVAHAGAARLRPLFHRKNVKLEVRAQPDLPPVRGERDQLARLLNNLLANALQFTPSGGRVLVSVSHERESVRIAVRDTGMGIAVEISRTSSIVSTGPIAPGRERPAASAWA
jgi:signal transduction histidine kinase